MKFYSFIIIIFSSLSFLYGQQNDFNKDPKLIEDEVEKKIFLLNNLKKKNIN